MKRQHYKVVALIQSNLVLTQAKAEKLGVASPFRSDCKLFCIDRIAFADDSEFVDEEDFE